MTRPGRVVHVVLPGDVDDPARPSGGNVYDRRVCRGLAAAGRAVREHAVAGPWPRPGAGARRELAAVLAAVPAGETVVLDGLVACGVPDVVGPHAARLRLAVLVHLPLGDEAGLDPASAADLAAREGYTLRAAATVVATSAWAARRIAALHGRAAHVVAPGVDPAPVAPAEAGGTRLLCVGSITPTKGQDLLVEALARVADRDWTCRFVGPLTRDRAHAAAVAALVRAHQLDDRVELTGPLTGADLDAAYARADLLVLPSRRETYGMVATEALARGVPVLAAAVGGVPETLGEAVVPGLLVAPEPGALAAALRRWLDDGELRRAARAAAARRRPGLPGWDRTARRLAEVLA
ncbi:MAG: glycosyltransferase family 4 protein [Pseudonocardia sp.]